MLKGFNIGVVVQSGYQPGVLAAYDYYVSKGFNCVRMSINMERMLANMGAALDTTQVALLTQHVNKAQSLGMEVILDFHNFGNYRGSVLGTPGFTIRGLYDAVRRLATQYPTCRMNFQNEPVGAAATGGAYLDQYVIAAAMNACAAATRSAGNSKPVHVSAWGYSNRYSFKPNDPNYALMRNIADPINPILDWHCYLDAYSRGQEGPIESGWQAHVQALIDWKRNTGWPYKIFVGEMAWRPDQNSDGAQLMALINGAPDVFEGWCWWGNDASRVGYTYRIQPGAEWWDDTATQAQRDAGPYAGPDRPQLAILFA